MPLITQGLSSSNQSLVTEGLSSQGFTPIVSGNPYQKYRPTYEGLVQVISDRLVVRSNYPYRPDSFQGIINALRDSGQPGERGSGYRATLQDMINLIEDKYGVVGADVSQKYPITYEGFIEIARDRLNPSEAHAPYPATYAGMIAVIFDAQV